MSGNARLTNVGAMALSEKGLAGDPQLEGRIGIRVQKFYRDERGGTTVVAAFVLVNDEDQILLEFAPQEMHQNAFMVYGERNDPGTRVLVPINIGV